MKKLTVILALMIFVAGCGLQKKEEGFSGVAEKKDYVSQGFQYLQKSDIPNAIQSFDLAIRQDPTNPDNYITLGQVYLRLRQPARAIDTLTAATKVAPNSGEAFYLLATSKAFDGRIEEAIDSAKSSAEIFLQQKNEELFKRSVALVQSLTTSLSKEGASQGTQTQ